MRRRLGNLVTLGFAVSLFTACGGDTSTAPQAGLTVPTAPQYSKGVKLPKPEKYTPVQRVKSLDRDEVGSATVTLFGGVIVLPNSGLSIVIPPGAAPIGTKISVTSHAGKNVAYEFEPHGTQFLVPLLAVQNLRVIDPKSLGALTLTGVGVGYAPDPTLPTTVTELLSVNVDLGMMIAVTPLWHFSGYIFVGGRSAEEF
jgi:ZU5 domain-containing protein